MKVADLERRFELAGYNFMGKSCPPVAKKSDGTFIVRILASEKFSRRGERTVNYDYFTTDKKGVITECPRGLTKEFKGVKIEDIAKVAKELEK